MIRSTRAGGVAVLALWLVAGCAHHIGTTAASFMEKVRNSRDPNIRYLAYQKLASPGCYDTEEQMVEAVRLLAERLESRNEPLASRVAICRSLGELGRPEGHDAVRKCLDDEDPGLRAQACRSLGKLGVADDVPALTRVMAADQSGDCRVAAIEGLGSFPQAGPRAQLLLVELMENDDPAVRLAAYRSLKSVSGVDLGTDVAPWREVVEARVAALDGAETRTR